MEKNKSKLFIFALFFTVIILSAGFISATQSVVNLGKAGDFVILSKTAVSTTGTTSIIGNVGVSPVAATYLTGFGLIMDSTNVFSTSSLVTGKLYAADYAVPTPINMGTAISDMETAYTDAAGRTLPDATELGAGDISGLTITPGLYKWGTGVLISAGGVTISGGANDIFIFQIAQDLTVANGAIITLSGGAQAKNIFWQVAGQTKLGTTSQMKGIILCQTLIEMQTGATLNGRALAQTAVTLDSNAITSPGTASSTPPAIDDTPYVDDSEINSNGDSSSLPNNDESAENSENTIIATSKGPVKIINGVSATITKNNETIEVNSDGKLAKLNSGNVKVETELPVEVEGNTIHVTQSNGIKSEIKIMPSVASEIALNRLRLKVCSEENNCTITLKEVGEGNETKVVYELKVEKQSKILWLFKKQMQVNVQVDAKNGEIIKVERPWWAFLAS